jgi:hypothetical protein
MSQQTILTVMVFAVPLVATLALLCAIGWFKLRKQGHKPQSV